MEPISDELFKIKIRADYRVWFRTNREATWDSADSTLMDLATTAKAYEDTEECQEKNRQLPSEYKKCGLTAVVGNVNWKSNKAQSSQQNQSAGDYAGGKSIGGRCWFCFETGHRKNECPMWKSVSKMVEEYDKGTLGGADSASVNMAKETEVELRNDIAAIACATELDPELFSNASRRAIGY